MSTIQKRKYARKPRSARKPYTRKRTVVSSRAAPSVSKAVQKIESLPAQKQASIGRMLLNGAGAALGGALGGPAGAVVGRSISDGVANIVGLGEYSINSNVLMHEDPLRVKNKSHNGETVIRHREFLGDVLTSSTAGAFNIQTYPINPGIEQTFPWLAQIASNFEQYRIEGMLFEFRSMSGDALTSSNTALGSVVMATQYNAGQAAFRSKSEMENYEFGSSCKPSSSMIHPIECARMQTSIDELYTRSGNVPSGQDPRLYDIGNFSIATVGMQGTSVNVGELWITYQVALLKPKMYVSLGFFNDYIHTTFATGFTNSNPFAGTQVIYGNTFVPTPTFTGTTITLPTSLFVKTYRVIVNWTGSPVVLNYPTLSATNGLVNGGTGPATAESQTVNAPSSGTTAAALSLSWLISTLGNGTIPVYTISGTGTLPTSPILCSIIVEQVFNGLLAGQ